MKRKSVALVAATAAGGAALAALAGAARTRAYLRQEYSRENPDAVEDFSSLTDLVHRTVPSFDGGELHLIERGPVDAPPLLFVHGVTLSAEVWRYQLRDLAGPFRVLALDQRGHGKSTVGAARFSLEALAEDIVAVLEALDLRGVVLVGHSMGGFAVQKFCIDHPAVSAERVSGIVLMNTACAKLFPLPKRFLPLARSLSARLPAPRNTSDDGAYLGTRWTLGQQALPSHVRFTYELSSATDIETTIGSVLAFLDIDLRAGLRAVKVPALVMGGAHDRLLPPRHAQLLAASLPGARLVMLPGCGHMAMLERHHEVDGLLAGFAAELRAEAA